MPRVSVIIPCYNQGVYLDEAVDSVLSQTFQDIEIIIVNDGSTDELTNRICSNYSKEKTSVITTANQGLAAARNNGIAATTGEFILPLDADDRIEADYILKAVEILDSEQQTGIVYCRACLFGSVETDWSLPEYSLEEMLKDNIVFCSALFRRSDWELVGGYDPGMIYGWEDYDFWLSLIEKGRQVKQLPGRYFNYRVAPESMVRSKDKWQKIEMFKRIYQRHSVFIGRHIDVWLKDLIELREPYNTCRLYVDCGNGLSDKNSVARKITVGAHKVSFDIMQFKAPKNLRFDPIDCPACLSIDSIELHTIKGLRTIEIQLLESNALYREEGLFRFVSDDPQVFIPVDGHVLDDVCAVKVNFTIISLGKQALQDIISYQKEIISADKSHASKATIVGNIKAKLFG